MARLTTIKDKEEVQETVVIPKEHISVECIDHSEQRAAIGAGYLKCPTCKEVIEQ